MFHFILSLSISLSVSLFSSPLSLDYLLADSRQKTVTLLLDTSLPTADIRQLLYPYTARLPSADRRQLLIVPYTTLPLHY